MREKMWIVYRSLSSFFTFAAIYKAALWRQQNWNKFPHGSMSWSCSLFSLKYLNFIKGLMSSLDDNLMLLHSFNNCMINIDIAQRLKLVWCLDSSDKLDRKFLSETERIGKANFKVPVNLTMSVNHWLHLLK